MLLQGLVRRVAARLGSGLLGQAQVQTACSQCHVAWPGGLPAEWGDEPLPSSPPSPARRPVPDPGVRVAPLRVYVGGGEAAAAGTLGRVGFPGISSVHRGGGPPRLSSGLPRLLCGARSRAWLRSPGLPTSCCLQVLMGLGASPLRTRLLMPALNRNAALPRGLTSCCRHSCSLYSEPRRRPECS